MSNKNGDSRYLFDKSMLTAIEYGLERMSIVTDNRFKYFGKVVGNRTRPATAQTMIPF